MKVSIRLIGWISVVIRTGGNEVASCDGAARTVEKIVADASKTLFCMIDDTALVEISGHSPLRIEVARSLIARHLVVHGATPISPQMSEVDRCALITENG